MKKYLFLALTLPAFGLLVSCEKTNPEPEPAIATEDPDYFRVKENDTLFEAIPVYAEVNTFNEQVAFFAGLNPDELYILEMPTDLGLGTYNMDSTIAIRLTKRKTAQAYFYRVVSGSLTITYNDQQENVIAGTFNSIMIDTVSGQLKTYTDGAFSMNY